MRRTTKLAASAALLLFAAACADIATTAPDSAALTRGLKASITPGTCTNLAQLNTLAATIFTASSSPNIQSVLGKLKNLDKLVKSGSYASAEAAALAIVDFTLLKHQQGGLAGTAEQVEAFTDKVLCFAGIDLDVDEPSNTHLIMPSDLPQIVTNIDGTAGISFPGNPVTEPTLIEFELIPDDFPAAGDGPLDTKLDQYPGFIHIQMSSENNAPLAKPAVVGVCATGAIPADVLARLRLGHNAVAGFEVTPPADASFLNCPSNLASAGTQPLWRRLASLVAPKALHASAALLEGGGVGGTVTEFSPFAPVDPQLAFGGGVGGTVTEFIGQASLSTMINSPTPFLVEDCSVGTAGTDVAPECRPFITVTTALGTVLTGVPVQWSVTAGGGSVAARTSVCGAYGATAATTTNSLGRAAACWILGAPGTNSVKATPSAGGDAPAGVNFVPVEKVFTVNAVAGPPVLIQRVTVLLQQGTAGAPAPIAPVVVVLDAHGYPVPGVTVKWGLLTEGVGSVSSAETVTGADGKTSITWILGPGFNHIYAKISFLAGGVTDFEAQGQIP